MKPQWRLETHDSLASTQDLLRQNPEHGCAVQALTQTGGQGRQGRVWQSPVGNLYISLCLKAGSHPPSDMAFVAAMAVYETAAHFVNSKDLMLKWPNDVLYKGKKLAGVLIEYANGNLLVGIGVNVQSAPDIGIGLGDLDVADVRDQLLTQLATCYDLWQARGYDPVRTLWLERAHPVGTPLQTGGIEGVFENIDHDGTLLLRDSRNILHRITAGDVNLVKEQ